MKAMRVRRTLLLTGTLVLAAASAAWAQRGRFDGGIDVEPNVPYDGRYTFVRLQYSNLGGRGGWAFDYPAMERNFMTILNDLTSVRPHVRGSNIHLMDDPALANYVVAYLSEPGYWLPTEAEAAGLRTWIKKGGFLIVDDFFGNQWANFERSIRMVLPEARIERLQVSHPIFHSFFSLSTLDGLSHPQGGGRYPAEYLGIFEDSDPRKRLTVIINYNNDIGDYMEWSGQGWYPVNFTNDAYKLATNYVIYGLTR